MNHPLAILSLLCVLSPLGASDTQSLQERLAEAGPTATSDQFQAERRFRQFRRLLGERKVTAAAALLEHSTLIDKSIEARMQGLLGEAWIREGEAARGVLSLRQALTLGVGLLPASQLKDWGLSLQVAEILACIPRTTHSEWTPCTLSKSRDKMGLTRIEALINDQAISCVWDTGANLSTTTETMAGHLGLRPYPGSVELNTPTGDLAKGRLALAEHLRLGTCTLENVVFLVLPDKSLDFPQAGYAIECILGFPVIDSLGAIQVREDDTLKIGLRPRQEADGSLLLEGLNPKLRVEIGEQRFSFLWDTGANSSMILASSLARLSKPVEVVSKGYSRVSGAGGSSNQEARYAKNLQLRFGSTVLPLSALRVATEPLGDAEPDDGSIGSDLMHAGGDYEFCLSTPYLVFLNPRKESD